MPLRLVLPRRGTGDTAASVQERVAERRLSTALSLYRYFSFMVAVTLMGVLPPLRGDVPALANSISLSVVGAHLAFRVFVPARPRPGAAMGYAGLALDLAVALTTLMATRGLDSDLLFYSFGPILTASIFLEGRVAFAVAGACTLVLLGALPSPVCGGRAWPELAEGG